jgi:ADP-heptose:LPS heptosyltransferase
MRVLVTRRDSFGDVLCTTPVIRRLRRELGPDATINVHTFYPYVFCGNNDVDFASNGNDMHVRRNLFYVFTGPAPDEPEMKLECHYDRVIDLNLAFEKRYRKVHAVDAYMEEVFGDRGDDRDKGVVLADVPVPDLGMNVPSLGSAIIVHPARSEKLRTLPVEFWQALVDELVLRGKLVITVGTSQDYDLNNVHRDTKNRLSPQQQAALIRSAACLVASESGILGGILPATDTPAVGLLTMSLPETCGPYRLGGLCKRFYPIMAKVDCVGCSLRYDHVITAHGCLENRDYACVKTFDPIEVADKVIEAAETGRDDG